MQDSRETGFWLRQKRTKKSLRSPKSRKAPRDFVGHLKQTDTEEEEMKKNGSSSEDPDYFESEESFENEEEEGEEEEGEEEGEE